MDAMAEALSALRWWREAGVDVLVDDLPRDWLKPAPGPAAPAPVQPAAAPSPEPDALPGTLAALAAWIADPATCPELGRDRIAATGDPASDLMILADMPETGDAASGQLLAGELGQLFDRVLAAIGRDRSSIYLAPLCPARPPGGRLGPALSDTLARVARHHVALVRPRRLLLMGRDAVQAFGLAWPGARGRRHEISHDAGETIAVATFPPRMLPQSPARKADVWADLRLLIEELER